MIQKRVLILLSITLLLMTTGCWSRKELNELAIVLGMGIDLSDGQLRVAIQVVEPEQVSSQKGGGGSRSPISTYNIEAPTITEALHKITIHVPRKPFLAHLRVLVIGEELARDGLSKVLDAISRHHEFRTDFFIIVAKDSSALEVLSINTELEKLPATTIYDALRTSEAEWAPTKSVTLDKLINNLTMMGRQAVLTGIKLVGNVEVGKTRDNVDEVVAESYLLYEELAIFRKDRLVGWFDVDESKGYNYIMGNIKRTAGHIDCPSGEGKISAEIIKTKTTLKGSLKRGKPHVSVHVRGETSISEVTCQIDLRDETILAQIEVAVNEVIENIVNKSISAAKKFNADIFGFGQLINRADTKAWKKLQNDWDELFVDLPVTVKSDVRIRNLGTLNSTYISDLEEKGK